MKRKAVVVTQPRTFATVERDVAPPAAGEVAVDLEYVGLCGTDLHIVDGAHPRVRFPLALGHEMVGFARSGAHDGRLVVVDPLLACGVCSACRLGHAHVCVSLGLIGIDRDGGLAGRVNVAADRLHPVADGTDPVLAALAEPLAVALHAVRRTSIAPGSRVVVIGAGPIGLLVALVARRAGASSVFVSEIAAARRDRARMLGFELLDSADPVGDVAGRTNGWMADAVIDAAAVPPVARVLPPLARPAGEIVLVGVYGAPVELDLQTVLFREQTIIGNRVYAPHDIDTAIRLLETDGSTYRPLVTGVFPLEATPEAVDRLRAGDGIKHLVSTRSWA